MPDKTILTLPQVGELLSYLDQQLAQTPCDHTRRLTAKWAEAIGVDLADLFDALDDNGGHCDCEVVMNIEPDSALMLAIPETRTPAVNAWCIPAGFQMPLQDHRFTKVLRAINRESANCYSADGTALVSAPRGAKARKRIRKSVHFFVGLTDGLPNEVGFVTDTDGVTASAFAKQVRDSGLPEFSNFAEREAAYFLSCLGNLPPETPVGSHFMEVTGVSARQPDQLRIHKVILRRK